MQKPTRNLLGGKVIFVVAVVYSLGITFMLLTPIRSKAPIEIPHLDKLAHLFIYTVLCVLWLWTHTFYFKGKNKAAWGIILLLVVYGIIVEILQENYIPTRSFDAFDILANSAGILLGFWIFQKGFFQKRILK